MKGLIVFAALCSMLLLPVVEAGHGKVKSKCKKGAAVTKVRHHHHVAKTGMCAAACCSSGGCSTSGCH